MKSIFFPVLLILLSVNLFSEDIEYTIKSDVNLRAESSTQSEIIQVFKSGDSVSLVDEINGWSHVRMGNGSEGYVSSEFIEKVIKENDESSGKSNISFSTVVIIIVLIFIIRRFTRRSKYSRTNKRLKKSSNKSKTIIDEAERLINKKKIQKLFDNESIYDDFVKFTSNYYEDVIDEIRDGKLDWNNENCRMFFLHMKNKYKLNNKVILALIFKVKDHLEYKNYINSIGLFEPRTFDQILKETIMFEILNNKTHNIDHTIKYLNNYFSHSTTLTCNRLLVKLSLPVRREK